MTTNAYGYGSHLPLLTHAFMHTEGPVLECGGGLCSTSALHSLNYLTDPQRLLVTADEQSEWVMSLSAMFASDNHIVRHVVDWQKFLSFMNEDWGLVLIDNDIPGEYHMDSQSYKRRFGVMKLLPTSAVWVVHDTNDPWISENAWWKERVASSPFVWTYEACGIQTTLLAVKELPEIGVRTWHRQ